MFDERFERGLDPAVWTPAYLPAWSSRAEAAATWSVDGEGLHLTIPPEQPLWCAGDHEPPLRVSAVQSANRSGPVGSTDGQQPFRAGQRVREGQPTVLGFTPGNGLVEVECRARLGPSAMFSAWLIGLEDAPERCGEICLVEVFGDTLVGDRAAVGAGIKAFRDPALVEDFVAEPRELDVTVPHRYAVHRQPGRVDFLVDGTPIRTCHQAPAYPMQLMIAVFDFPDHPAHDPADTPELVVRRVTGP
ncbi:glycoside hydrolase family 16 protein [Actinomycetospora rhizophila]|uniref:Glycoside hydrolase family 16 protein n=1 Tax=Actinomycetospora rhizophila TaxID=1416876 RepID=A0ABV9ZN16_9PSEU